MMLRDTPPSGRASSRRARAQAKKRRWRGLGLLIAFTAVAGAAVFVVLQTGVLDRGTSVLPGQEVRVAIAEGASTRTVGRLLEDQGVIADANDLGDEATRRDVADQIKPGEYQLETGMAIGDVLDILVAGPDATADRLTFPEGLTTVQIAERMVESGRWTEEEVDAAFKDRSLTSEFRPRGKPLEGLLFPATYPVRPDEEPAVLLRTMLDQLDEVMARQDFATARELNLTDYDVLIVASLIEREAKVEEDRAKIARVIYNRMRQDMRLQIDATIQYALKTNKALSTQDLQVDSPYNTYRRGGLPPTPIATPGEASIQAALAPEAGDWLFYVVADAEGRHAFSETLDEHNRLKAEAQRKGLL